MALLLAGIDEAGYGPTLGPMCVGLTVWRVERWEDAQTSPNLWKLLAPSICRKPVAGARGKSPSAPIAIADSKLLKRPNDATTVHPLGHLERGVLAAMACTEGCCDEPSPADDLALLARLSASGSGGGWCTDAEFWYATDPTALPVAGSGDHLRISANVLRRALVRSAVKIVGMWCRVFGEYEFNSIIGKTGSKGDVTLRAVGEHVQRVVEIARRYPGDTVHIVCDRLGGREHYGRVIEEMLGGRVVEAEELPERSRYWAQTSEGRRIGVAFQVEAERSHMPVALSSMMAKYVRELGMTRFNRYWGRRSVDLCGVELKPTAGYALDARRWLEDAREIVSEIERGAIVRKA
ncbi:MAG TPA: hypothetical protein VK176_15795 [Phycisphaerales bacterium]|nr:hypothetical protein [Phycisphaerales bacterium]